MKNWMITPEQFDIILCQDPLSIHSQYFVEKSPHYVSFSVGRGKSSIDVIVEVRFKWMCAFLLYYLYQGFNYLDVVVACFHRVFPSSNAVYESTLKQWITFLMQFLNIADTKALPAIKKIVGYKHIVLCTALWHHFLNLAQV